MRYHETKNIELKDMIKKGEKEFGLCCYKYNGDIDTEFIEQVMEVGETGEVIIFTGEMWSLCAEGYKVVPSEILERIEVRCVQGEKYKEIEVI